MFGSQVANVQMRYTNPNNPMILHDDSDEDVPVQKVQKPADVKPAQAQSNPQPNAQPKV
jgi:hypothetical protein